mgnify:CR=1 FL=1
MRIGIDLTTTASQNGGEIAAIVNQNYNINSLSTSNFAGVTGLDLSKLNDDETTLLDRENGMFGTANIHTTLGSLSVALSNINEVASYVGGVQVRLSSQNELLQSQITNYNAAISRIEDADVAQEQLDLIKSQFLQQASLISLAQANQQPQSFLQLFS